MKLLNRLTNAFPFWVLAGAGLALAKPELFTWFKGPLIPLGLGIIMLGMGLTMTAEDFRGILRYPKGVFCGAALQYLIMPFLGWSLSYVFKLPAPFAVGLILVACCPGGTASNVVTYLAGANVPLSVTMTTVTTLMAVVMTPALTAWLAGSRIAVNFWGLLFNTFQVVIIPVAAGVAMNQFMPRTTKWLLPAAPLAAVFFITLIVSSIVGLERDEILRSGPALLAAVFFLHAGGYFLGYVFAYLWLRNKTDARTVSIEVGMQNSGLGVVLARSNFASPLVAIPCAISSVIHSLLGSLLAAIWRRDTI